MINLYRAKILRFCANTEGPITWGLIHISMDIPSRKIYDNLKRMVRDGDLEERSFRKEGIDPMPYRISEKGGDVPRSFYLITPKGLQKLEYYKSKKVYDMDEDAHDYWRKRTGAV